MSNGPTPQPTDRDRAVPLCVDLDGTLIKTDLLWESLSRLLVRNPLYLLPILFWWMRGRAFLKKQLAARVKVDPATLPYHDEFVAFLREAKRKGRRLVLATASDLAMAKPVADYVGVFDEVLASDGKTNLRGANKLRILTGRFGERGFDYAGNSSVDLAVWRGAREAIVVNAGRALADQAGRSTKLGPTFPAKFPLLSTPIRFLDQLFIHSRYLAAILAGLTLAAAFLKLNVAGFAWVAPAFMIAAAHGRTSADAFRIGYVAGLATWLASLYWLLLIPVTGFPILGWLVLGSLLALYTAVWVWLLSGNVGTGDWARRTLWSLAGAVIWVALEMVRARLFGGFPWNLLGASQFQLTPLIQIASVTGVYGVSFLVVWFSLSLVSGVLAIFRRPTERYAWLSEMVLPIVVVVMLFTFGFNRLKSEDASRPALCVTLIQPSIPQTMIWNEADNDRRFAELLRLSVQSLTNAADLLVWPEAGVPKKIRYYEDVLLPITALAQSNHVWMIVGSDDAEPVTAGGNANEMKYFNASFLISPSGDLVARYCKRNLVMFGEYVPLSHWLPFLHWLSDVSADVVDFTPGDRPVPFQLNGSGGGPPGISPFQSVKTSSLICFEDTFPHLVREYVEDDTDFLVNLTNDGWFGESAAQWQHAAGAIFRAVENGRPLVRCCNNGLTCWADSRGRLQQIFRDPAGSEYGSGALTARIPLLAPGERHLRTFYNLHGDWFGWSCVGLTGMLLAMRIGLPKAKRDKGC